MALSSVVADITAFVAELVPEMDQDAMKAPEEKAQPSAAVSVLSEGSVSQWVSEMDMTETNQEKKKKKKKGPSIYDMFEFDPVQIEKVQPVKKPKEKKAPKQVTQQHLENTLKAMERIVGKVEQKDEGGEEVKESSSLHRFPSPSRSRQNSPQKSRTTEDTEEQKVECTLKATAAEFVPPGFSPAAKGQENSEEVMKQSTLKASASEFVPPGFTPPVVASSLPVAAAEFVPPVSEKKVAEPTTSAQEKAPLLEAGGTADVPWGAFASECAKQVAEKVAEPRIPVEKKLPTFDPPRSESSTDSCWAQAVFAPVPAEVPAPRLESADSCNSKTSESGKEDSAKWTDRLDVGNIFGKVSGLKQSLTSHLCCMGRLAPNSALGTSAKDPFAGKAPEKVKKTEDEEAEKQAKFKAVNAEFEARKKEAQLEMDDTLMDCFLQAVTTRIKDRDLPVMGTSLYGKMRLSRQIGTSCDVKDSSFVWMRPFLESLEDEGLIKLKPEVQDPTVMRINRSHKLIRNWKPWAWNDTVGSQKAGGRR